MRELLTEQQCDCINKHYPLVSQVLQNFEIDNDDKMYDVLIDKLMEVILDYCNISQEEMLQQLSQKCLEVLTNEDKELTIYLSNNALDKYVANVSVEDFIRKE